jgi:putative Holliday junction resolvase
MTESDISLDDLKPRLRPGQRLLGLDLGSRTIGIAISDLTFAVATALYTIKRTKFRRDAAEILALCEKENVGGIVIGMPFNMDGTEGPRAQSTRAFVRNLAGLTDIPVTLWDERLSTAAVTRALIEADASRKTRSEVVDKVAAAYILQGALDRLYGLEG